MGHGDADRWQWMKEQLVELEGRSQFRSLVDTSIEEDGWIVRHGQRMLNLASNDYLGLNKQLDASLLEKLMLQVADNQGGFHMGGEASRLITGNDPVYTQFEEEFAQFKGTESSLIFSSGYMANLGIISSLVGRNDLVFSDRLNHASIVDGITLSRAEAVRYRHRDLDHLENLLRKADSAKLKLIVTDAIFSMDGSMAPLHDLIKLKNQYGAMLMVDEAHSGGVYGEKGEGLTHALGLNDQVDIQMGTFSKAYGCYGAYVAVDSIVKRYLVNKARSFIYTTALPSFVIQAIRHNWALARDQTWRKEQLLERSTWFRERLQQLGYNTGDSVCQIIPVILGNNEITLQFSEQLQAEGVAAVAIRPPTVPEGEARVRFTLMSTHRYEDLQWAIHAIEQVGRRLALI